MACAAPGKSCVIWRFSNHWLSQSIAAQRPDLKPHEKLASVVEAHFDGGYGDVSPEGIGEALEALFDGFWLNILMYPARYTNAAAKVHIYAYPAGLFPRHFTREGPREVEQVTDRVAV